MLQISSFCDQGKRKEQEDRFKIIKSFAGNKHLTLLIVCDGHGGQAAANWLIDCFPIYLCDTVTKAKSSDKYGLLMKQTLERCVQEWDKMCFGDKKIT